MSICTKVQRSLSANSGITIIELLVVLLIVAITITLVIPSIKQHQKKVQRANAKIALLELMHEQRQHFSDNNTYSLSLQQQMDSQIDGYDIEINTCGTEPINNCVELAAIPSDLTQLPLIYTSRNKKLNW